jgi:hypothetical protein
MNPTVTNYARVHLMDFAPRAFQLRPAASEDFQFAWSLYRSLMQPLTVELLGRWNDSGQQSVVEAALKHEGTSIIVVDGLDAGWLHVIESDDSIYLVSCTFAATAIVRELRDKATQAAKALTLDVMKNNRARSLYERLGFGVVGESKYKLKMRWQENAAATHNK